jgi:hypothetical protein
MKVNPGVLERFVVESNLIEGIKGFRPSELEAAQEFLDSEPSISELQKFVGVCEPGAVLRDRPGLNVRVGSHLPPQGGPDIRADLVGLLKGARSKTSDPYATHIAYETLHPFTDCNGRSGRILWAWQMVNQVDELGLDLGFLHRWYYQTLSHSRR